MELIAKNGELKAAEASSVPFTMIFSALLIVITPPSPFNFVALINPPTLIAVAPLISTNPPEAKILPCILIVPFRSPVLIKPVCINASGSTCEVVAINPATLICAPGANNMPFGFDK
ncbi:MAG: hypothetical protein WCP79_15505 [Bacillota bacterium]